MKLRGRPATAADIETFYPGMTNSFRAWVCELDGEPQGIIGIALMSPFAFLFSKFKEALRPFLRHPAVLRLIKKVEAAVKASSVTVYTIAQADEPTAPGILERLGFHRWGELEGDEIFEWVPGGA